MSIQLDQLPALWREHIFNFVTRKDQDQTLKEWCYENEIVYNTARTYFTQNNRDSAIAYLSKLQDETGDNASFDAISDAMLLSDCSLTEFLDSYNDARTIEKTVKPETIYLEAVSESERPAFQRIWDSGMDLKGEIALYRYQLYRAKLAQTKQDEIEEGERGKALILIEQKRNAQIDHSDENAELEQGEENKYALVDWDRVIHSLGQLIAKLMSIQYKIDYGQKLTNNEQTSVISRVIKMIDSESMTAVQGSMALASVGIKDIPLPVELKMREELQLMGDVFGERVNNPQDRIDEEKFKRKATRDEYTEEFLEKRAAELEELNANEDQ